MNSFAFELSFAPLTANAQDFDDFLDTVMDALEDEGVSADLTASLAAFTATFSLPSQDLSVQAQIEALTRLQRALHAARCATPGWPSGEKLVSTRSVEQLIGA